MKRHFTLVACAILSFITLYLSPLYAQQALEAGTYYIQNKETGTFLSSGAQWGTRCVLAEHGVDFKVTVSEGKYTLVTQLQGASKALRPSDGYMDQSGEWTIEPLSDGTYALYNGSKYFGYAADNAHPWVPRLDYDDTQGDNTHWRFWSPSDLLATLSEANRENPVDATFFIQAPNMLIGDYRITGSKVWGNDLTNTGGNTASDSYLLNCSNGEAYDRPSFNVTQTLTGIPNGIYSLSVQGFYRFGSNSNAAAAHNNGTEQLLPYLYAGSKQVALPSVYSESKTASTGGWDYNTVAGYVPNNQASAAACFDDGTSYVTTITDIVVADGTLTIGIAKNTRTVTYDWTCFDSFTLLYYGSDLAAVQAAALEELSKYEALNTTEDEDYAQTLDQQRQAIENATTEEEIAQAMDVVKKAYQIYLSKPEPEDTPLSLTFMLQNASLDQGVKGWDAFLEPVGGSSPAWTLTTSSNVSVLEAYAGYSQYDLKGFSLLQPVTLAPGMYRLKGYAFYRYGTSYNSDLNNLGEERSQAYLVAGDFSQLVMRLGDIEQTTYPNSMSEAADAFNRGQYLNSLIFELDEPTTLMVGYRGEHDRYRSWFVAGPIVLEKINDQILASEAEDDFALLKTQYARRWEGYKSISSQALEEHDFDQVIDQAKQALSTIDDQEALDALDGQVWQSLTQLLRTCTTATGQFDITALLQNPSLVSGTKGWQTKGSVNWDGNNGIAEITNQSSNEFSQSLSRMPAGSYTLKVQALYRMTSASTTVSNYETGGDKVVANLFINDQSQSLRSINDDARYLPCRPASDAAGPFRRCIPNSINGAADAFKAGLYWNVLRAQISSDSDLTLGLRLADGLEENWLPFDNFRLYYGNPVTDVQLISSQKYTIDEDTYANITTDIQLYADHLNPICVPFDIKPSQFQSVWTLGGIDFDADTKTLTGTLIPYEGIMRAGESYLVGVASDQTLAFSDVLLRALQPDSIPALWDGGATQGYFGRHTLTKTYRFNEEGKVVYTALKSNVPGFTFTINLPPETLNKAKSIELQEIDFSKVNITINLENYQARSFLKNTAYSSASVASVIEQYNLCPPCRRDQPHTVMVPVVRLRSPQTLTIDEDPTVKLIIPAGESLCEVANLIPQRTYHYTITDQVGSTKSRGQIQTQGNLRMIKVPSVSNVRDMGGWKTSDGLRTRYGLIYRGGEMNGGHQMNDADCTELMRLGIGAEIDLREDIDIQEYNITCSAFGNDVPYIYLNQNRWNEDALELDTAKYHRIMDFILDNLRNERSVYFHCI